MRSAHPRLHGSQRGWRYYAGICRHGLIRYGNTITGYRDLVTKALSITKARTPEFYAVMTQPEVDGQLIEKRDLLFIALALALGGMLAIVAALVCPSRDA